MNVVLIIPTGIGAEIGGHAGDGTPVAKLIGSVCDKLITHPNVVNSSDINEMPDNTLYVEGSTLDEFLEGIYGLKEVHFNRILCVTNAPLKNEVVNSVSAARATIGADIDILVLKEPLRMRGTIEDGIAGGKVTGWEELVNEVIQHEFDALAITTPIEVDKKTKTEYWKNGGVNPFGKVEAIASRFIAQEIRKPVAHSPAEDITIDKDRELFLYNDIVDPRIASEMVSISYLHCILKGLHKAPQNCPIEHKRAITYNDVDFLVTPANCVGRPHMACRRNGIKIIAVKENKTCLNDEMPDDYIVVDNYLEAAGIIAAHRAGVHYKSVRRPLEPTVIRGNG